MRIPAAFNGKDKQEECMKSQSRMDHRIGSLEPWITKRVLTGMLAILLPLAIPTHLSAQGNTLQLMNYRVLHAFSGQQDGAYPSFASVIVDNPGNVYGTASQGGDLSCNNGTGCGVVFKINPGGHQTILHNFEGGTDGALIDNAPTLVQDADGNLYGTADYGGDPDCSCGLVFKIDRQGHYSVIHYFNGADGRNPAPNPGLLLGSDGNFYGTAGAGGNGCGGVGCGVVFKMDPQGTVSVLYNFTGGADGLYPSGVVQDSDLNLYGTASYGGDFNAGVVFKVDPQGHESVLYSFTGGADGGQPVGGVVLDEARNAYGTGNEGGAHNGGVVFKLDAMGHESLLYSFTGGTDGGGQVYTSLIRDDHGNLYGTTYGGGDLNTDLCGSYGCGTVFKVTPTGHESVLYAFRGTDGALPYTGVFRDRHGNIYGTTGYGGDLNQCFGSGCGVVFKLPACNSAICRGQD
jgi:uncharacterized repeat protein (TIGR03803 family)